jgi:hypothetical protein
MDLFIHIYIYINICASFFGISLANFDDFALPPLSVGGPNGNELVAFGSTDPCRRCCICRRWLRCDLLAPCRQCGRLVCRSDAGIMADDGTCAYKFAHPYLDHVFGCRECEGSDSDLTGSRNKSLEEPPADDNFDATSLVNAITEELLEQLLCLSPEARATPAASSGQPANVFQPAKPTEQASSGQPANVMPASFSLSERPASQRNVIPASPSLSLCTEALPAHSGNNRAAIAAMSPP